MKRKLLSTFTIIIVFSLLTTGLALAKDTLPTWVMALDHDEFAELGFSPIDFNFWPFHGSYVVTSMEQLGNYFYAYVGGWDGCKILRSSDGENWEALTEFGLGLGQEYTGGWDMISFDNRLYVGIGSLYAPVPAYVARSSDGITWEPVLTFEFDENFPSMGTDKFGIFDEMIYVTTHDPGQVWRSPTGDPGTWEMVLNLGDSVSRTSQLVVFKDWLYVNSSSNSATLLNTMNLYRTQNGLDWEIAPIPVADPLDYDADLAVHQGQLYLSTGNWTSYEDGSWANLGGRIYRTKDGTLWETVTDDGFGDLENFEISGLFSFQDDIYATIMRDYGGAQVWRSHKGDPGTWVQLVSDGWGDESNNWGSFRNMQAEFKGELYIAGWSFNAPIWKMVP